MKPTELLGAAMIIGLLLFALWLAARDGHARAALTGMLYGAVTAAFIGTAVWLLVGGAHV